MNSVTSKCYETEAPDLTFRTLRKSTLKLFVWVERSCHKRMTLADGLANETRRWGITLGHS